MTNNMSAIDRIVRMLAAMLILFVIAMGFIGGPMAWLLGALGLVLAATSASGHCPAYKLIGIDSHVHDGHEHFGG